MKTPHELAQEHWDWVGELLVLLGVEGENLALSRYLFTTAIEHGFKHGMEVRNEL